MTNMTITHPAPSTSLGKSSPARSGRIRTVIALGAIAAAAVGTSVAVTLAESDPRQVAPAPSSVSTPAAKAPEQFSDVERGRRPATSPVPAPSGAIERGLGPKSR